MGVVKQTTTSKVATAGMPPSGNQTLTTMAAKASMLHGKRRGRRTSKVKEHLPHGAEKVASFPRQRNFAVGEVGAVQHTAAMRIYSAEFAGAHEQDKGVPVLRNTVVRGFSSWICRQPRHLFPERGDE